MMKKLTTVILSAALMLGLTSCTFTTPSTVLTVDGREVAAGIYLIYQYGAFSQAQGKVKEPTKDVFKQEIEGVKAEEWIYNETIKSIKNYIYTENAFKESGLSFAEEQLAGINAQLEEGWKQNEKNLAANGIGKESYMAYNMSEAKKAQMFQEQFVKDSANNVSDADAKKYMEEKYSRISSLTLPIKTADYKELDKAKADEVNALAEQALALAKDGKEPTKDSMGDLLKKSFEITGREYTEEAAGQYIAKNFIHAASTTYPAEIVAKLVAAKEGDCGKEEIYDAPFVWVKVKTFTDDAEFENYKPSIVSEMQSKAFEAEMTAVTDKYTVSPNAGAVKTYSPKKIKAQ